MMQEVQSSSRPGRASVSVSLLLGLLFFCGASLAPANGAAQSPVVTVYHSSDEAGADPRPAVAPGCTSGGAGGGVTIDFDALDPNEVVTAQFPEATFTSTAGYEIKAAAFAEVVGSSPPNYVCAAGVGGGFDCTREVFVDFTTPVSNLSFRVVADNNEGVTAVVDVYQGESLSGTVDIITDGDASTANLVDLSEFSDVTRIHIRAVTDSAGLGYDDFSFGAAAASCVIQGGPNEQLELWIDGGPSFGGEGETVCKMGDGGGSGDQLCGADIVFQLTGVGSFTRLIPDAAMDTLVCSPCSYDDESQFYAIPADTQQLRLNFRRGDLSPGPGARRLATLVMESTGLVPPAVTRVTAFGEAAGAALQLRSYASAAEPELVATSDPTELPEPGWLLQLSSGLLGLAALRRLRS